MGKKLRMDDFCKSSGALQKYYIDNGRENGPFHKTVEVINKHNRKAVLEINTNVIIQYDNTLMRINIMWEDVGIEDFRSLSLYGYYDCYWVPMEYEEGLLTINSTDSDKIIKVHL